MRRPLAWLALVLLGGVPRQAVAFEREWHLGAQAGVAIPRQYYQLAPLVGGHAAYGISDLFDIRVEAITARLGFSDSIEGETNNGSNLLFSLQAGLAYKVDVLRWVPYIGLLTGCYWHAGRLPNAVEVPRVAPGASLALGLDYAVTRQLAVGLASALHVLLPSGTAVPGYLTALVRVEKRWGW